MKAVRETISSRWSWLKSIAWWSHNSALPTWITWLLTSLCHHECRLARDRRSGDIKIIYCVAAPRLGVCITPLSVSLSVCKDGRRFEFSLVSCSLVAVPISSKMWSFNMFVVYEFHWNPFSIFTKRKEYLARDRRRDRCRDGRCFERSMGCWCIHVG